MSDKEIINKISSGEKVVVNKNELRDLFNALRFHPKKKVGIEIFPADLKLYVIEEIT